MGRSPNRGVKPGTKTIYYGIFSNNVAYYDQVDPNYSKSAGLWFIWLLASSRTAFFTPRPVKEMGRKPGFPVDFFVWCGCFSRNDLI